MEKIIVTTPLELKDLIQSSIIKALKEIRSDSVKNENQFFSLSEASKFLNLAPQTIYGLTSSREIPFIKKGKKLTFKKEDLIAWLENGRKATQDELKSEQTGLTFKTKGGLNE